MSDIFGTGHGSAHDWEYQFSTTGRASLYTCRVCGERFVHAYDEVPDIFEAMADRDVPGICKPKEAA